MGDKNIWVKSRRLYIRMGEIPWVTSKMGEIPVVVCAFWNVNPAALLCSAQMCLGVAIDIRPHYV